MSGSSNYGKYQSYHPNNSKLLTYNKIGNYKVDPNTVSNYQVDPKTFNQYKPNNINYSGSTMANSTDIQKKNTFVNQLTNPPQKNDIASIQKKDAFVRQLTGQGDGKFSM